MTTSRRKFLTEAALGLGALLVAPKLEAAPADAGVPPPAPATPPEPGAPPAFNTAPAVGPAIDPPTIAAAEKLAQVRYTAAHEAQAANSWPTAMAPLYERRVGPRRVALEPTLAPATQWNPILPGMKVGPSRNRFVRSRTRAAPLPSNEEDIAFAPLTQLSQWIRSRALSSEHLTRIYLDRLERFDPKLHCVITLTAERALAHARGADAELRAGRYRGPLHGIPWGAKDLLDTAGIRTTYGAEPFRTRVPERDAAVVERLDRAGAVLVAKLSLGALALNDVWFGGQTKNPWLLEEGSSGSSAGPGAATAAGLVGFAIGSETEGSIISPSLRCGVSGLRPTFGRVPRTGAMTLCWSLDKLGPMARAVEDTMLVLSAIAGPDAGDLGSLPSRLDFDANAGVAGLKVGYFPKWLEEPPATEVDRAALERLRGLGLKPVAVSLPDWPFDSLNLLLFAEAAAAFEEITLDHRVDAMKMQVADAWPNMFRSARFLSAVDYVQADRLRRRVAEEMARVMREVDLLLVPGLRDEMLVIGNFTGHPALTLRTGFVEVGQARSDWAPDPAHPLPTFSPKRRVPHGVTLIGRLFDEGTISRVGIALERAAGVAHERPSGF